MGNKTTDDQTGVVHVDSTGLLDALDSKRMFFHNESKRLEALGDQEGCVREEFRAQGLDWAMEITEKLITSNRGIDGKFPPMTVLRIKHGKSYKGLS